ncbi:MAG: IMP dehydrogenase [bacterium]
MDIKFDFDDILIVPEVKSHITSRYKDITLPPKLPLFTAPMDTVVDLKNKHIFSKNKINVVLPRTIPYESHLAHEIISGRNGEDSDFVSLGFDDLDKLYNGFFSKDFKKLHQNANILIDVANGNMQKIVDYTVELKRLRPDITIMVGNIANPETYRWYAKQKCVDFIRLGVGNGGGCLTTKQSGIGYPMASLIYETKQIKNQMELEGFKNLPKIIADGGMKDYSDIIKALALGADYVMLGSILNKCLESCADNYLYGFKLNKKWAEYFFSKKYPVKKYFRGMSTKEAQKAMGKTKFKTSEGVVRFRKVEYKLSGWVENFEHYLRNAMSYSNCKTLEEFIGSCQPIQITPSAYNRFNK